jgi:hypothetical protein
MGLKAPDSPTRSVIQVLVAVTGADWVERGGAHVGGFIKAKALRVRHLKLGGCNQFEPPDRPPHIGRDVEPHQICAQLVRKGQGEGSLGLAGAPLKSDYYLPSSCRLA